MLEYPWVSFYMLSINIELYPNILSTTYQEKSFQKEQQRYYDSENLIRCIIENWWLNMQMRVSVTVDWDNVAEVL